MKTKIVVLLAVFFMVALAGCSSSSPVKEVRLNNTDNQIVVGYQKNYNEIPLRVAVSSIVSPKETLTIYQPLLEYLEMKLGQKVVLLQRKTYKEVNELITTGHADIAFVCSGNYGAQMSGMELLVVPEVDGDSTYQSFIIAGKHVDASSLSDLRGRSFAYTDPLSFSGHIAPIYMISLLGYDADHFFGRNFYTFSHDNSIQAVSDGIVDAAAVDSMIYKQAIRKFPNLDKNIKVVDKSIVVGSPPVVVNPKIEAKRKEELRSLLLTMHMDPQGKEAINKLDYDKFVDPEEENYSILIPIWLKVKEKL